MGQSLIEQGERFGIGNAAYGLAVDALDQRLGGRFPVRHERPQALGVEHLPDDVSRSLDRPLAEQPAEERIRRGVGGDDVPVPVHHDGGAGLMNG